MIRDCLGREREVGRTWPNGWYDCPFCHAACAPEGCRNPACFARIDPPYPADIARERLAAEEHRRFEEEQRKRNNEAALKRAAEERAHRQTKIEEILAEARRRGACERCALREAPYREKYIRHRKKCPKER